MRSIRDIVGFINSQVAELLPGIKTYGVAKLTKRDKETLPAEGETYIGIDDTYKAQVYHKINGLTIARQAAGFGDQVKKLYTYQMSMILFLNRIQTEPEDIVAMIDNRTTQQIKTDYTQRVTINFLSAILNDEQVYSQEYKNSDTYRLGVGQRLLQINYTLEALYKPGCFDVCPEEINCKN